VFGTELGPERVYKYGKSKFAIFSWHGCSLSITGAPKSCYVANETPMVAFINAHTALNQLRKEAKEKGKPGPVVMVVGPTDSGKTTLCRILTNYAVRSGWQPSYVDLDVGQSSISIPGTMAATVVEHTIPPDVPEALQHKFPLVYFFGHSSPSASQSLYCKLMERMAVWVDKRAKQTQHSAGGGSGAIINSCGWVEGAGYELQIAAAKAFNVDVIFVVGHDKLFNELQQESKVAASVLKLAKSGGVVSRDVTYRRDQRMNAIKQYFYGPKGELSPHSTRLHFKDAFIFRVGGGPQAPSSALPIGSKRLLDPNRLTRVTPSVDIQRDVLAVSFAKNEKDLLEENVAGFIFVSNVDVKTQTMTILAPSPGPLPSYYFLCGSIKWYD